MDRRRAKQITLVIIWTAALLPLGLYWQRIGRVPKVSPAEARLLMQQGVPLVDVRAKSVYAKVHLVGAMSWPLDTIEPGSLTAAELKRKRVLMLCGSSVGSSAATLEARKLGIDAISVAGGLQEWIAAGVPCPLATPGPNGNEVKDGSAVRDSPVFEQWAMVFTFIVVKLIYMAGALGLVIALRRQTSADLVALRWSLLTFFIGEMFCYFNVFLYQDRSLLLEYLHGLGMALAFGFATYALLEGLDLRLIHYSEAQKKCAAMALCGGCVKNTGREGEAPAREGEAPAEPGLTNDHGSPGGSPSPTPDVPCTLRRLFLMLIPALAVAAAIPLFVDRWPIAYNTRLAGLPGRPFPYGHHVVHQLYEFKYLPTVAIILLLASFVILLTRERHPAVLSRMLFAAAMGAMGYSFLRLLLFAPFTENQVWYNCWEEITELLFVGMAAGVVWVMRKGLVHHGDTEARSRAVGSAEQPATRA